MRDAGVAVLRLGPGLPATTEERSWGLIDYDEDGQVACVEIRKASTVLPTDLLAVLPDPCAETSGPGPRSRTVPSTDAPRDRLHELPH
jgi:uncharacterized protein YuzE